MKKREPLIFSEAFFRGTEKAVAEAVAESEAAGLPKAYLDSYDQLHQDEPVVTKRAVNER